MSAAAGYKRIQAEGDTLPREAIPSKPEGSIQEAPPTYASSTATAAVVTVPSSKGGNGQPEEPPKDYLVYSVLAIFCCFMPLGVIALLKSLEVRSATNRGDLATAREASQAARKFNKWSLIVGIIIFVAVFVFTIAIQLAWVIPLVLRHKDKYGHGYNRFGDDDEYDHHDDDD